MNIYRHKHHTKEYFTTYKSKINNHINNGDNMNNIDIRAYIISNFKEDNIEEIRNSIEESIASHDEDPLIGLGVLFELFWNNSTDEEKEKALSNIKKGM